MSVRVLVTGVGGPAGRSLVSQLLVRGIEVAGVDMVDVAVPDGVRFARVPAATDAGYGAALLRVANEFGPDLIIPTVSEELPVLAHPARIGSVVADLTVISPLSAVALADDKWLTYRCLQQAGVAAPRSALPAHLALPGVAPWIGNPHLVKPRVGRGGRGITLVSGLPVPESARAGDIVQEFVPGAEYCPNLYVHQNGAITTVVLVKTGLANGLVGNATGVAAAADSDVAAVAERAVRALGLTGPVDLDVRRRADGTPVVLEANARFGANSAFAPAVLEALLAERVGATV